MNENGARRRLKAIERELRYYGKKRDKYLKARKEMEERNRSKTRKILWVLFKSLAGASLFAILIYVSLLFSIHGGDTEELNTICVSASFIAVALFLLVAQLMFGEEDYIPQIKRVSCKIEELKKERDTILSDFPALKNERVEVRFVWTWYSIIKDATVSVFILFLVIAVYWGISGSAFIYNYATRWGWILLLIVLTIVLYLEERSLKNCLIRKELGVDPKRLYR